MDRGELVPDDVVMEVLREHLLQGKAEPCGFVLDGVPRNIVQAEALAGMLGPKGLDVVINLDVSTEVVLRRIAGRRVCTSCGANYNVVDNPPKVPGICDACGGKLVQRDDDTEDAVKRRLRDLRVGDRPVGGLVQGPGAPGHGRCGRRRRRVTERIVEAVEAARQRKAVGD